MLFQAVYSKPSQTLTLCLWGEKIPNLILQTCKKRSLYSLGMVSHFSRFFQWKTRWWFQTFFMSPRTIGEMIQFDFRIFFRWVGSTTTYNNIFSHAKNFAPKIWKTRVWSWRIWPMERPTSTMCRGNPVGGIFFRLLLKVQGVTVLGEKGEVLELLLW